ncbi:hypothetical protein GE21DRAFT_1343029, partial [Neurospora crassa]
VQEFDFCFAKLTNNKEKSQRQPLRLPCSPYSNKYEQRRTIRQEMQHHHPRMHRNIIPLSHKRCQCFAPYQQTPGCLLKTNL